MNILNKATGGGQESRNGQDLAKHLQKSMLRLKGDHMTEDGRGVDYSSLASSEAFVEYTKMAGQLAECDCSTMSEEERKAFFINVYNCLTIHGLASAVQLPSSVLEVSQFWKNTAYNIGGHAYSLDDIEHGILRGNRPHPSSDVPPFSESDQRRQLSMTSCDPRVHFALVCGAKSCPPIQVYSSTNLERALSMAASNFCSQEVSVEEATATVRLSKIFLWYGTDFASSERDLLQYLVQYVSEECRGALQALLSSGRDIDMKYTEYNWQLNKL